jgi:hypothetical protein
MRRDLKEEREEVGHVISGEKSVAGTRYSKYKGPEACICLVYCRTISRLVAMIEDG